MVGLDWAEPMMILLLHVTCSCIFMHTYLTFNIFIYIYELFGTFLSVFFLPPHSLVYVSALMAPECKSAPSRNPFHSEALSSSDPTPFSTRCSFGTLSHFVRLLWHWPTHYHSQSRLGVIVWHPGHLSIHADLGVLLQHAWTWLFSTSFSYSRSRYTHSCHTGVGIWCALCPEGKASWPPRL